MTRAVAVELLENRRMFTSNLLTLGGSINDGVWAVEATSDGGRVLAGQFSGTINFSNPAAPTIGDTIRTARGQSDLFVARYAPSGALLWVNQIGADAGQVTDEPLYSDVVANVGDFINAFGPSIQKQGEYLSSLSIGPDGNYYIAGSFQGTVDFDPSDTTAVNRKSAGYHDAFIAAYSEDGTFVWASAFGGPFDDVVKDIGFSSDGAVVATGYFTREADFNPTKQVKNVVANGRDDIFVAKFLQTDSAPIGRLQWVYTAGGDATDLPERDTGEGLAFDGSGNIYVTGSFAGESDWDPTQSKHLVKAIDKTDVFLLRLSPKGKLDYIQSFGSDEYDGGKDIVIDDQGRMYISGYFSDTADLDPGAGEAYYTAREDGDDFDNDDDSEGIENFDMFIEQVGLKGGLIWVAPVGGDDYEWMGELRVENNTVLLSGAFAGQLELNGSSTSDTLLSIEGDDDFDDGDRDYSYDAFVARYNADDGSFSDAVQFGGTGDDWGLSIGFNDVNSTVELGGIFRNTASFNPNGGNPKRKAIGRQDLFAVSIDLTSELA